MPVEENGTPGTAATNPMGSAQQPGAISDLGDILLDKSLDTMQKNDFVAVTKNDVAGLGSDEEEEDNDPFPVHAPVQDSTPIPVVEHATIEDLQNIMLDAPTSESPFSDQTPVEPKEVAVEATPTTNNDLDLGDISTPPAVVEAVAEPVVENITTPVEDTKDQATVNNDDFNLGDISNPPVNVEAIVPTVVESVTTPVETPVSEDSGSSLDFDLGDIGTTSEATSETPSTTEVVEEVVESAPVVEATSTTEGENNLDFDLGDMSGQVTPDVAVEEVVPTEEVVVEETDNSSIDLGSLDNMVQENSVDTNTTQIEVPVVAEETPAESNEDIVIDTSSLEIPTDVVIEDVPVEENNIPTEAVVEISPENTATVSEEVIPVSVETPIETPVVEVPTTSDVGSSLDSLQNNVQTENLPQPSSNPEAVALEKVADDITQGIDLDSLMVDTPTVAAAAQVADEATAKQTPTEGLKAMFSGSNGNQKKVLIGLGAFALIGLIYFGYVLMADSSPSTPTPQVTTPVADTGDTMDELSGDVVVDEVATGIETDIITSSCSSIADNIAQCKPSTCTYTGTNNEPFTIEVIGPKGEGCIIKEGGNNIVEAQEVCYYKTSTLADLGQYWGESVSNISGVRNFPIQKTDYKCQMIANTEKLNEIADGMISAMTKVSGDNTILLGDSPLTPAELLGSAKSLAGKVRKALIKATIMKNAQMRLSAFGLQKDVETFIQTLENSNDMTTVSDSETKLNSLSQRLDSILQKLDGSSQ